jgi:hypothetical protein
LAEKAVWPSDAAEIRVVEPDSEPSDCSATDGSKTAENTSNFASSDGQTAKNAKNRPPKEKEKTESEDFCHSASPNGLDASDLTEAKPTSNGAARAAKKRLARPTSEVEKRIIAVWREHPEWSAKMIGSECATTAKRAEQIIENVKAGVYDG